MPIVVWWVRVNRLVISLSFYSKTSGTKYFGDSINSVVVSFVAFLFSEDQNVLNIYRETNYLGP